MLYSDTWTTLYHLDPTMSPFSPHWQPLRYVWWDYCQALIQSAAWKEGFGPEISIRVCIVLCYSWGSNNCEIVGFHSLYKLVCYSIHVSQMFCIPYFEKHATVVILQWNASFLFLFDLHIEILINTAIRIIGCTFNLPKYFLENS